METTELLQRFEAEYLEVNSISPARRKEQLALLQRFALGLSHDLDLMTPRDVMAFMGAELSRGMAPNTVRKRHMMIRAFETWAASVGIIDSVRTAELKSVDNPRGSSPRGVPRPYKRAEVRGLFEIMAQKYRVTPEYGRGSRALSRYYGRQAPFRTVVKRHARRLQFEAMISLALEEGLRRHELYWATLAELHYDNPSVVVRTAKGEPGTKAVREVPYTPHSRNAIREWLDFRRTLVPGHDFPWLALQNHNPTGAMGWDQYVKSIKLFGDIYCWHRLRHTFATERLRNGMRIEVLQVMMGHSRLEQTLAYARISSEDIQLEAERTEDGFEAALGLAA